MVDVASFGAQLQTKTGGDAIEKLADEEIRLLESIRQHLQKRAKADIDYAAQLYKINQTSPRFEREDASPLAKAWTMFLQQSDCLSQRITEHAKHRNSTTLEHLEKLINAKRNARRRFATERRRVDLQFAKVQEEVEKLKKQYRDFAKDTETQKNKFEESLKKNKPKDIEKSKEKYAKAASKLHSCHNDYLFAMSEANLHQEAYKNHFLPLLLNMQQEVQEFFVEDWKEVLKDYFCFVNLGHQDYIECCDSMKQAIEEVEKKQEYVTFIMQNKTEPAPVVPFEFDTQLLELTTTLVELGKVVLNNLTVEMLRDRQESVENRLKETQETLEYRNEELKNEIEREEDPDTEPEARRVWLLTHLQNKRDLEREIEELKHQENKLKAQEELINGVLGPLGEDDAPLFASNLPVPTQPATPVHQPALPPLPASPTDATAPPADSPAPPPLPPTNDGNLAPPLPSTGADASAAAPSLPKGGKSMGKALGKKFKKLFGGGKKDKGRPRDDSVTSIGTAEAAAAASADGAPSVAEKLNEKDEDDGDGDDDYVDPPETKTEDEPWYHGDIGRRQAEGLCVRDGDYIVRHSGARGFVLTTKWLTQPKHFIIQEDEEKHFRFEGESFFTVRELLQEHVTKGLAVTRKSGVIIRNPINRKDLKKDEWALSHDSVVMGARLGKGNFGDVYKAKLKNQKSGDVAVKTCRSENITDCEKFLKEAEILKQYRHPNIVKLIGICSDKEPVYIIMELMLGGDFLTFLRKKGAECVTEQLTQFGKQAAAGMEYLEAKNCIHRDLAARNCLISGDNKTLKISDFGMSREEDDGIYTVSSGMKQIPIKWTAPEALNYGTYTTQSDVWSYGILLFETFSLGSTPYPGMNNRECREKVEIGYRMTAPKGSPPAVYDVMKQCWEYEPEKRPTFKTLHGMMKAIVDKK